MHRDPVVEATRAAARSLEEAAGHDRHRFFANLRAQQTQYADRLVETVASTAAASAPHASEDGPE